jgi:hypothetical protein
MIGTACAMRPLRTLKSTSAGRANEAENAMGSRAGRSTAIQVQELWQESLELSGINTAGLDWVRFSRSPNSTS